MNIKYLHNGEMVEIVAETKDGRVLVQDIYYDLAGNPCPASSPYLVDKVFDQAPTRAYDERVVALREEIEYLQKLRSKEEERLSLVVMERSKAETGEPDVLKHLRRVLSGEYNYVVVSREDGSHPEVEKVTDLSNTAYASGYGFNIRIKPDGEIVLLEPFGRIVRGFFETRDGALAELQHLVDNLPPDKFS